MKDTEHQPATREGKPTRKKSPADGPDRLMVASVEKAFLVLSAFGKDHPTLSLTQVAAAIGMDISTAQRFTHTLTKLGYLRRDPQTKYFELTSKSLDFGYHYIKSNRLIDKAMPYLLHLSKETEEAVNLTTLDGEQIVFVSRFMSRHVLNTDVIVGTRMPAYCTAPGLAMLAQLPSDEIDKVLDQSDLKPFTPYTIFKRADVISKLQEVKTAGFATAYNQIFMGDGSIAAAIINRRGEPEAAVNIGVSCARYTPEQVSNQFSSLVIATARSISQN